MPTRAERRPQPTPEATITEEQPDDDLNLALSLDGSEDLDDEVRCINIFFLYVRPRECHNKNAVYPKNVEKEETPPSSYHIITSKQ